MIELTRRYHFPAAHVLTAPSVSTEENRRIFGKCANPNGHGHNYGVEVTVTGPVDPETGAIVPVEWLDQTFDEQVRARFAYRTLNDEPEFRELVSTAENVARVVYKALAPALATSSGARLARVRIVETANNTFEYGDPA